MQCRDGVIRHCLATLLATNAAEFHALTRRGAGHVIKRAAQKYPELRLDENLSEALRHAGAHYDYDVDGDCFITHDNSGNEVRLVLEHFVDQVLGYLQTGVALMMALMTSTSAQGIALEMSKHTPERDLLSSITALLGFTGLLEPVASWDDELLSITATGDTANLTNTAVGIAGIAPARISRLSAQVTGQDGVVGTWVAQLDPFRQCLQRPPGLSDMDEMLALARVVSAVRLDSESIWNTDMWAGIALHLVGATSEENLRTRVLRAKEIRDIARSAGDEDAADSITRILEAIRQGSDTNVRLPAALTRVRSQ